MAELFECAGTQFDPELVERFAEFREGDGPRFAGEVAAPLAAVARSGSWSTRTGR